MSKGHRVAGGGSREPLRDWRKVRKETVGSGLGFRRAGSRPLTHWLPSSPGDTCSDAGQMVQPCACPSWQFLAGKPDSKSCLSPWKV